MNQSIVLLALAALFAGGCRHSVFAKRAQEECCPTDIRKTYCLPWGEDAVFKTPCCPDAAYHGYKPTCWREWQAPAEVWRDERCGPPISGQLIDAGPRDAAFPEGALPSIAPVDDGALGATRVQELPPVENGFEPLPPEIPPMVNGQP